MRTTLAARILIVFCVMAGVSACTTLTPEELDKREWPSLPKAAS